MKTSFQRFVVIVIAALGGASAQGPLTPPGPPGTGTMKSLDQIEARTPISLAPFTISQSGSYYLTTNIAVTSGNAITITADNVTLDLNGFTLSSTEPSPTGRGILLSGGRAQIHILNGHIKGSVTYSGGVYSGGGFAYGISYSGGSPRNVHVSGVSVSRCMQHGIDIQLDNSTVVDACTVQTVGGHGIVASSVSQSAAKECGMRGINADTAINCRGESTGSERGVSATSAQNCYGTSGSGNGVSANNAQNCFGLSNGNGHGVSGNNAQNCVGWSFGLANGINVLYSAHNCYGQSGNGTDINASIAENCYGFGYRGMIVTIAQNCYGNGSGAEGISAYVVHNSWGGSDNLEGIRAEYLANGCFAVCGSPYVGLRAYSATSCVGFCSGGTAINATIANGCIARFGTTTITYKYNMP
jgi:hypothetical protein